MSYSIVICKLVDVISASLPSKLPNSYQLNAKTVHNSHDVRPLQYGRVVGVVLGQVIMTSLTKQFTAPQICYMMKILAQTRKF